jgi:hypothetical protein
MWRVTVGPVQSRLKCCSSKMDDTSKCSVFAYKGFVLLPPFSRVRPRYPSNQSLYSSGKYRSLSRDLSCVFASSERVSWSCDLMYRNDRFLYNLIYLSVWYWSYDGVRETSDIVLLQIWQPENCSISFFCSDSSHGQDQRILKTAAMSTPFPIYDGLLTVPGDGWIPPFTSLLCPLRVLFAHTLPPSDLIWYRVTSEGENSVCVKIVFLRSVLRLKVTANVVPSLSTPSTLMMGAIRSSETSVFTRATLRHIPEDSILHSHHRENFKSCMVLTGCAL